MAWSKEQAELLRAGKFAALDVEHLADEILDVGKSEQRERAAHHHRAARLHPAPPAQDAELVADAGRPGMDLGNVGGRRGQGRTQHAPGRQPPAAARPRMADGGPCATTSCRSDGK
ncbi:DUF29 family protein [Cupriavidus oxalaticus]|uniref:DUF29 family protein n=1 Tax=Cupriavidus oxalaticus TaxID=96344 RepID=UPI003F73BE21